MTNHQTARIIRVPFGLGANKYPGLALGPAAVERLLRRRLREFQLDGAPEATQAPFRYWLEPDCLRVAPKKTADPQHDLDHSGLQHLPVVRDLCADLRDAVRRTLEERPQDPIFPVVLGGDHSIAIGTLAGIRSAWSERRLGVVWIDSHADYNTGFPNESPEEHEYRRWWDQSTIVKRRRGSTVSGHIHGMPLAVAVGLGESSLTGLFPKGRLIDPADVVLLGTRDLDREERDRIAQDGLLMISARAVEFHGVVRSVRRTVERLKQRGVQDVHISFDIDCLDGNLVPGTGTRVPGGLTFAKADLILKLLRDWLPEVGLRIASFELVEVNPVIDREGRTARLAARLLCAFLGEEIGVGERFPLTD